MSETIPPQPPGLPETLSRPQVPALDAILGRPFKVLDDGFVRVVDYMGSDASIVQAARVSYGAGTKMVSEDRGLIRYLLRHAHTTPFEMCELKLHVRVPMDCWRQWIRHRTASVNEYSTRYSLAIDRAQLTAPNEWRSQSADNKQGSGAPLSGELGAELSAAEKGLIDQAREVYEARIAKGVAREQARKDLPLSTYTEAYWKCDLHNLLHFLWLRMDPHAQFEIRSYAQVIGHEIVAKWCPHAWEAFCDYRVGQTVLSRLETTVIGHLTAGRKDEAIAYLRELGWLEPGKNGLRGHRERQDLEGKLRTFGIAIPWL